MSKIKSFTLILGVLIMSLAINYFALAWDEAPGVPPGGNVSAPLNVGDEDQYKIGSLYFPAFFDLDDDPFFEYFVDPMSPISAIFAGKVGIATTTPQYMLDVAGEIHATEDICTDQGGTICLSTVGGGGGNYWVQSGSYLYASSTSWNVGIGTTDPEAKLEVSSTSDDILRLTNSGGALSTIFNLGADNALRINNSGSDVLTLKNNSVGIRNTNPGSYALFVNGSVRSIDGFVASQGSPLICPEPGVSNAGFTFAELCLDTGMYSESDGRITFRLNGVTATEMWLSGGAPRIGIGTPHDEIPAANLHVVRYTTSADVFRVDDTNINDATPFLIDYTGNVGIGTPSPGKKLDVVGDIHATGDITCDGSCGETNLWTDGGTYIYPNDASDFRIFDSNGGILLPNADRALITRGWDPFTSGRHQGFGRWGLFMEPSVLIAGIPNSGGKSFKVASYNVDSSKTDLLTVLSTGNVGIGTASPGAKLDVAGEVRFSGISGDSTGKVVCIKGDNNLGTCQSGSITDSGCTCI